MRRLLLLLLLAVLCFPREMAAQMEGSMVLTPVEGRRVDTTWFREHRLGLFLVWGLYTQTRGVWDGRDSYSEFIQLQAKIPLREMKALALEMNPARFDAGAIVRAARDAGMGYVVITAKHHEGFAMYRSPCDPFNIVEAMPFGRDPIKELSDACTQYGLRFCVYYSLGRDWADPDVPSNWPRIGGRSNDWDFPDEASKRFERYFERKAKPQIREILTQYRVDALWFDTPGFCTPAQSLELMRLIDSLSPGCLVNDRVGNRYGDFLTPEQTVMDGIWRDPWESCVTAGQVWSYTDRDTLYKSPEELVRLIADIVSKGGNLLLSVPPDPLGELTPQGLGRMAAVGRWMHTNREAIDGTRPWRVFGESFAAVRRGGESDAAMPDTTLDELEKGTAPDIRFTCKPGVLYVIARSWDAPQVMVRDLLLSPGQRIRRVSLLGYRGDVTWQPEGNGMRMERPAAYRPEVPVYVYKVELSE